MTSEEDFTRTLLVRSGDRLLRHMFADWCDDNGRPAQAKYLRSIRDEKFARRVDRWKLGDRRCDPFTGVRVQIPQVVQRFAEYYRHNGAWGLLHTALDDGNIKDSDVRWCVLVTPDSVYYDQNGSDLAKVLASMTLTQRGKLSELCGWLVHIDQHGNYAAYHYEPTLVVAARVKHWSDFVTRVRRRDSSPQAASFDGHNFLGGIRWADGDYRDYESAGG